MKKFKIFTAFILLTVMCLSFISCDNGSDTSKNSGGNISNEPNTSDESKDNADRLTSTLESKHTLKFNENGQFKVLVLSDLHLATGGTPSEMKNSIKTLVDREQPNLIILNGDNVDSSAIQDDTTLRAVLSDALEYIESNKIPWMHVYGNHDSQYGYTREQQQAVYESFEICISKAGDNHLTGVGNYVIPIYGSNDNSVKFAIWALDSGDYLSAEDMKVLFPEKTAYGGYGGTDYDYIHGDQIEWYLEISKLLQEQNGGKIIPGIMAFHIPLQESYTAWINRKGLEWTGKKRDLVAASAHNSGLFNAAFYRGDIKAIVNGHDHINDYMVEYGGIKLCYVSTITVNSYNHEDMHGGRVFIINENDTENVETYMSYIND